MYASDDNYKITTIRMPFSNGLSLQAASHMTARSGGYNPAQIGSGSPCKSTEIARTPCASWTVVSVGNFHSRICLTGFRF